MGSRSGRVLKQKEEQMTKQELSDILILMGGLAFVAGVFLKILGQEILFHPLVYWRFSMGCLAVAMALLLQRIANKK